MDPQASCRTFLNGLSKTGHTEKTQGQVAILRNQSWLPNPEKQILEKRLMDP
jgi:hypothetical protein